MAKFEKGQRWKLFYQPENLNNKIIHIRGIVDGLLVVCVWNRYKQRWYYTVEEPYYYERLIEKGYLTLQKGKVK